MNGALLQETNFVKRITDRQLRERKNERKRERERKAVEKSRVREKECKAMNRERCAMSAGAGEVKGVKA